VIYKRDMSDKAKSNAIVSTSGEALTPELILKELQPLTSSQLKCLKFILDFYIKHRHYPTHREIMKGLKIKGDNADPYLKPLEAKGYLVRVPHKQRSIKLTPDACEKLKLEGVDVEERLTAAK
jgi:DNA-binding MarR family transcriptional regulator